MNATEKGAGGFVAGTLVHTKEGLKPIEEIRVGDWVLSYPDNQKTPEQLRQEQEYIEQIKVGDRVLSKPESGSGEKVYKQVVNIFAHEDQEIWFVQYYDLDTGNPSYIYGTANHPIWVKGKGWTNIDSSSPGKDLIELEDGRYAGVGVVSPVYATVRQDAGFRVLRDIQFRDLMGRCIDFTNINDPKNDEYPFRENYLTADNLHVLDEEHRLLTFKRRVFNIEVEDFHTYYVGQPGVWVHNCNCGGVNFETLTAGVTPW